MGFRRNYLHEQLDAVKKLAAEAKRASERDRPAYGRAANKALGLIASASGDREEAVHRYRETLDLEGRLVEPTPEALAQAGGIAHDLGRFGEAREFLESAIALARRNQNEGAEHSASSLLAALSVEVDDEEEALGAILRAQDLAHALGHEDSAAYLWLCRAWLEERRAASDVALRHFRTALAVARRGSNSGIRALALAALACADARAKAPRATEAMLSDARVLAEKPCIPNVGPAVALLGLQTAYRQGVLSRDEFLSRLEVASRRKLQSEARLIATLAARELRCEIDFSGRIGRVAHDGGWFSSGTMKVDLSRKPTLRRVLSALAESRLRTPDRALPWRELLARAWGDEAMCERSGFQRVRTAIWSLRKMGLAEIECLGGSYRLTALVDGGEKAGGAGLTH